MNIFMNLNVLIYCFISYMVGGCRMEGLLGVRPLSMDISK